MKKHGFFKIAVAWLLAVAMLLPSLPFLGGISAFATQATVFESGTISLTNVNNPNYKVINTGFQVGFGRGDFTPSVEAGCIPCALGSSETSQATEVWDHLYATCIAMFDGEKTSLIFSVDLKDISDRYDYSSHQYNVLTNSIEKAVEAAIDAGAVGLTKEAVFFNATHNHNAPSYNSSGAGGQYPEVEKQMDAWRALYYSAVEEAAREAVLDLAAADAYAGQSDTTGINFIRRHYTEEGSYAGTHANINTLNAANNHYLAHETLADPQLQTLHFRRAGKKDIVMVNWQAHCAGANNESGSAFTSDYVHYMRKEVEEKLGVHFIYIVGAGGNVTTGSTLKDTTKQYWREVGSLLLPKIAEALEWEKWVDMGKISTLEDSYEATYQNDLDLPGWNVEEKRCYTQEEIDAQIAELKDTYGPWFIKELYLNYKVDGQGKQTGTKLTNEERLARIPTTTRWGQSAYIRLHSGGQNWAQTQNADWGNKTPLKYWEFQSWYEAFTMYARAITTLQENDYSLEEVPPYKQQIPFRIVTCGDFAVTFSPYEMSDTNGQDVKRESPFGVTFVAATSNGYMGYIPSRIAWERESYHARANRLSVENGGEILYAFATKGAGYEVNSTRYLPVTGEECAEKLVEMLVECADGRKIWYVGGEEGVEGETRFATLSDALKKAASSSWGMTEQLEIQIKGSCDITVEEGLLFGAKTIWRENNTRLPITISGVSKEETVLNMASANQNPTEYQTIVCGNSYTFRNLTLLLAGQKLRFSAGSGEVVFDSVSFGEGNKLYFYADAWGTVGQNAFSGWSEEKANKLREGDTGLIPTSLTFRNTTYDSPVSVGWQGAYVAASGGAFQTVSCDSDFSITAQDIHAKIIIEEGASLTRVNGYATMANPAVVGKVTLHMKGGTVKGLAADGGSSISYHSEDGEDAYQTTERNPKVDIIVHGGVVKSTGDTVDPFAISGGTDSKYGENTEIRIVVSGGAVLDKIVGIGGHSASGGGMESVKGTVKIEYNGGILKTPESSLIYWVGGDEKTTILPAATAPIYGINTAAGNDCCHQVSADIEILLTSTVYTPVTGIASGGTKGSGSHLLADGRIEILATHGDLVDTVKGAAGASVVSGEISIILDGGNLGKIDKDSSSTEYYGKRQGKLYLLCDQATLKSGGNATITVNESFVFGVIRIGEGTGYTAEENSDTNLYFNKGVFFASSITDYEKDKENPDPGAARNDEGAILFAGGYSSSSKKSKAAGFAEGSRIRVEMNGTLFSTKYAREMYLFRDTELFSDVTVVIRSMDISMDHPHTAGNALWNLLLFHRVNITGDLDVLISAEEPVELKSLYPAAASTVSGKASLTIDAGEDPSLVKIDNIKKFTNSSQSTVTVRSATLNTVDNSDTYILAGGTVDLAGDGTTPFVADQITAETTFTRTQAPWEEGLVLIKVKKSGAGAEYMKYDSFGTRQEITEGGILGGLIGGTKYYQVICKANATFSASIVLKDRLSMKLLLEKSQVESAASAKGGNLTYTYSSEAFAEEITGTITEENLNGNYYEISLPAVGAGSFNSKLCFYSPYLGYTEFTVNGVAELGASMYKDNAKALFEAILDYGYAANPPQLTQEQIEQGVTHQLTYYKESAIITSDIPAGLSASAGAGEVIFTTKTLLMGDANGMRLKSSSKNLEGITVMLNETDDITAYCNIDSKNGFLDIYVSAKDLNTKFTISVYDQNGTLCLTLTDTIKNIANQLVQQDETSLKAKATLYFIQMVQNYLGVPLVTPPSGGYDDVGTHYPLFG